MHTVLHHCAVRVGVCLLALMATGLVHADNAEQMRAYAARLNQTLNQLANDPKLGGYAQSEQAIARNAINQMAQADSARQRSHALYVAQRRVEVAGATAQLQAGQAQLVQLDRQHDQIMLDSARAQAEQAQRELEQQQLQAQLAQEDAQRAQAAQAAGQLATQQALQQAAQARKVAASQGKVAAAAKRQADLAAKAARMMRKQIQENADAP